MTQILYPAERLIVDAAAASSPQGLVDRRELALIAVERTLTAMTICDPRQPDNPIVLANAAFLNMTGYAADEVIGRNCRFLQGPGTAAASRSAMREAIAQERAAIVEMLNYRKDGSTFVNRLHLSPIHDEGGRLLYYYGSQSDVSAKHYAQDLEAAEHALLREVDHRAKNALALVQGIVRLSNADNAADYSSAVQGRVEALAAAHALLADGRWRGIAVDLLLRRIVEPYGLQRVSFDGPPIRIGAAQVQPLALVVHEIVSNAVRFGGLSHNAGALAIDWHDNGGATLLRFRESGGPKPVRPSKPGFGLTIIDAIIGRQLRGKVALDWAEAGLVCEIVLPPARPDFTDTATQSPQ